MTIRKLEIPLLAAMLLCAPGSLFAQQERQVQRDLPIPDSLKEQLRTKVDEARILKNWKGLKKGMLFKEVESLLGEPTRIASSIYDHSTTWHYEKRCVIFDNVKRAVRYWEDAE